MKNENFSRFCKAGHSETKRAKKGIILSLFMQFIMQSICFQSLMESLMESTADNFLLVKQTYLLYLRATVNQKAGATVTRFF